MSVKTEEDLVREARETADMEMEIWAAATVADKPAVERFDPESEQLIFAQNDLTLDYEETIKKLAIFDGLGRDFESEVRKAVVKFKTTVKAINGDVRRWREAHKPPPEPEKDRQSQAQRLIGIGLLADLWHDRDRKSYATVSINGHIRAPSHRQQEFPRLASEGLQREICHQD